MEELRGLDNWAPFTHLCLDNLPDYGGVSAVYALRSKTTGEILYIGSTRNLRKTVFGSYMAGVGGVTSQRLHELLFSDGKVSDVEFAWVEAFTYQQKEDRIREEYRRQHGHPPRWGIA